MTKQEWLQMDEDELWALYIKTKEPHIRDILIEKYSPLVKYVAASYRPGPSARQNCQKLTL